jgi:zinc protease
MSKKQKQSQSKSSTGKYTFLKTFKTVDSFQLENGLRVLYMHLQGTGVVTTNITYGVGARDERAGETGLAHMLEHMLFKQTTFDIQKNIDSGAMQFERDTGCILNANTWKDRTTYFFSYPKEYLTRALQLEAERMHDVILSDKEFLPERNNVLSEFDMYFGDPYFALETEMVCAAFRSHPYGHETIGFREDIERYTTEMLAEFYNRYYDPSNATLTIIGDIDKKTALDTAVSTLGAVSTNGTVSRNIKAVEPKQEGMRRVTVERDSNTNIVAFGVKHEGFPEKEWFETQLLASILTDGPESLLYKRLIDTGLASRVEMSIEPTSEKNMGVLCVTLTKKATHALIEKIVFETISNINHKDIAQLYKKIQQKIITAEIFGRESSLSITRELTEYISANAWEKYFETETILKSISTKDIVAQAKTLFDKTQMVIGHYIGKSGKK